MWQTDAERRSPTVVRARRPLILAAILGGALLQHLLVASPTPSHSNEPADMGLTPAVVQGQSATR